MSAEVTKEGRGARAHCRGRGGCARGVREVSATCDSDGIAEADGSLMFPEVLRLAPGVGISARLIVPHVGNVLQGAPVGKWLMPREEDAQWPGDPRVTHLLPPFASLGVSAGV